RRVADFVEKVGELGLFVCAPGVDDLPEGGRLRRRCLGVEVAERVTGEKGGDIVGTASVEIRPKLLRVAVGEAGIHLGLYRPSNKMTAIVRGEEDAVELVVGGDDDTAAIRDIIFGFLFLVDTQHIGRRRCVRFQMLVKLVSIEFTKVVRFVDAENYPSQKSI